MNHLFRSKPHFQEIVNKQTLANHRLINEKTTRTQAEKANLERHMQAVPLTDVDLPKVPLVRLKDSDGFDGGHRWAVLGEVAQTGQLILLDVNTGVLNVTIPISDLELVPPTELA